MCVRVCGTVCVCGGIGSGGACGLVWMRVVSGRVGVSVYG